MTRKKFIIYTLLTILMIIIGLTCGYFLLSGKLSETATVAVSFDFKGFQNLIVIVLIEFIFGFSILSIPVCFVGVFYRGLIYGCSLYYILNNVNRCDLSIFYTIVYLFVLVVYVFTSMFSISYSKTLSAAVPDMHEIIKLDSTRKYIRRFIICSAILFFLHAIKILYLYIFY